MVLVTIAGLWAGLWKLLSIGWVAFLAMGGGIWLGTRAARGTSTVQERRRLVWAYGVSSGAMITSATLFLVPAAIGHDGPLGGIGIAAGIIGGFAIHMLHVPAAWHRAAVAPVVWELSLHSMGAGVVIGAVYAVMPSLGPLLGLAILSHKGPAGYAAARRLRRHGQSPLVLLLPAAAVGGAAIPVAMTAPPTGDVVHALLFGGATGLFLHVALDFLPHCDWDHLGTDDAHETHDGGSSLQGTAVLSTVLGGIVVVVLWGIV
ncbi:MAG: ZIP family metal transporter [Bacteroidetes bacterium SW_9_63_38]|nr:MAG: ZIP family metal transporter [Bacteroidetes bacterium SW_9_63_38]